MFIIFRLLKKENLLFAPAVFTLKNKTYVSDSMYIEVIGNSSQGQNSSVPGNAKTDESGVASNSE